LGDKKKDRKKEEEKKRNGRVTFFPRAGHPLLAVLNGIFAAVRCN
jgi:hypothetical protein